MALFSMSAALIVLGLMMGSYAFGVKRSGDSLFVDEGGYFAAVLLTLLLMGCGFGLGLVGWWMR
jgi:hypothetical protein